MKAGIAAMCAAAARAAATQLDGEIIIAAVADEEYESIGTRSLIERGVRADAAIVTEPTRLAIMPAHLGFRVGRRDDARTRRARKPLGHRRRRDSARRARCSRSSIGSTPKNCRRDGIRCSAGRRCTRR